MKLDQFLDKSEVTLSNGAILLATAYQCEVCVERNEIPEASAYRLEFEGQQIELCATHAEEVLQLDADKKEDEFKKFITITDPKESVDEGE